MNPLPNRGADVETHEGELVKVDAQIDQLVREMNRSIAEADKFIQTMEKEPG